MLEGAGDTVFDFGAFKRGLAQADVVNSFDPGSPGIDLRFVDITSRGGVTEEKCQRQTLITRVLRFQRLRQSRVRPSSVRR